MGAESDNNQRIRSSFGTVLFTRLASVVVFVVLIGALGLWISSLASNNQPTPIEPIPTNRPIAEVRTEIPITRPTIRDSTPLAMVPDNCPITEPKIDDPPDGNSPEPLGEGEYYINEDRTIWGKLPPDGWRTGGQKAIWILAEEGEFSFYGRNRAVKGLPLLEAELISHPRDTVQVTRINFPTPGCWEMSVFDGRKVFRFDIEVAPADMIVSGLTLLDYKLSEISARNLKIDLFWQTAINETEDFVIFFKVSDFGGNVRYQYDQTISTDRWNSNYVTTTYTFFPGQGESLKLLLMT